MGSAAGAEELPRHGTSGSNRPDSVPAAGTAEAAIETRLVPRTGDAEPAWCGTDDCRGAALLGGAKLEGGTAAQLREEPGGEEPMLVVAAERTRAAGKAPTFRHAGLAIVPGPHGVELQPLTVGPRERQRTGRRRALDPGARGFSEHDGLTELFAESFALREEPDVTRPQRAAE